jgi:C4-dicarboxylate-specific signal transduction histidine kinase
MEKAREEAERQLEEQRARAILSDRLRSLGEMATGMAHELNQPLLGVRGLAEHILIGLQRGWNISQETILEKIRLIIDQTERMTHVIEHARTFARGADNSEIFSVQVNDVIKSSMDLIGAQLRYRGLILQCNLAENLPTVLANPFSLEEVILNLINNARDAFVEQIKPERMENSPHIIVQTSAQRNGPKNFVKIEVIDYGAGIPQEFIQKVFDPFFTTKDPDKGTGLGLAISKSIIEGFHGHINIQSSPGSSTTVTVTLPVNGQNWEKENG